MKNVFVILSGGPCVFDPKDPDKHDMSWDNFVTPPLLRATNGPIHDEKSEEVRWLVYEPAYNDRWTSDIGKKALPTQSQHANKVKQKGFSRYIGLIKERARKHGWKYEGLSSAQGFWDHINNIKGSKVSRVWFYGHARYDLWLSLNHDADHEACSPTQTAILQWKEIKNKLKPFSFVPQGKSSQPAKFVGCNTYSFAEEWAKTLSVRAEGALGKVDFKAIHESSGKVMLSPKAGWYQYAKAGVPLRIAQQGEIVE